MKAPERLKNLIDEGRIDLVPRQLTSGMVYVARRGDATRDGLLMVCSIACAHQGRLPVRQDRDRSA